MKIRSKLLLLEGGITVALFISLIISLVSLINLSEINGLYKSILDKGYESKQLRLKIEEILYHPDVNYDHYTVIAERWEQLSFSTGKEAQNRTYRIMDREFKNSMEELNQSWLKLTNADSVINYIDFFDNYFHRHKDPTSSLFSYMEVTDDALAIKTVIELQKMTEEIGLLETQQRQILNSIRTQIPEIIRSRLTSLMIINAIVVLGCIFVSFYFGHNLMDNVRKIRYTINKVSSGEFSHKLKIESNDEFGRLARDFNSVTEALWAKLESVQHILQDVGDSISNEIEVGKVEKAIVYLGQKSADASGAGLYLFNEDNTELLLTYAVGDYRPPYPLGEDRENVHPFNTSDATLASFKEIPVKVGENLIGEAALKGEATLVKRTYSSSFARPHNHPYHINSAIAIPIRVGNHVYGVLSLIQTGDDYFSDLELANAESFCELAAISIDNLLKYNEMLEVFELNREIDIAAEIQQNLLPQQIPQLRQTDIAFKTRTCRGINGDFYDCYMLDRETVLIAVCEVAGKGVPAALVITMIKTILKLVAKSGLNGAEIMETLNRNITEKIRIENIATLSLLLYNQNSGALSYASAGSQPLLVYRSETGKYEELQPQGIPVGLDKNAKYQEESFLIKNGDFLYLFTDGIPEARSHSGKEYGVTALKEIGLKLSKDSAEKLVEEIIDDLNFFHRDSHQWDDQTIFTLKRGDFT
ncbi:MAG: SpoIIE family protein phosphatase [Spirochaetales bacterium]|nr:SpoIIE family protein phosphatase [Spirochaetales bacterium]